MSWFRKSPGDEPQPAEGADPTEGASPEIEPLTDAEVEWVRSTIAELEEQGVRLGDIDDLGRHYDELLTGWLRIREPERPDPNGVINQIGLAFGQHIADHTGLAWGIATDQHGPEIALHRRQTAGQILIYPTNTVAKRWVAHETGMLAALARATIQEVREIPYDG